MIMDGSDRMEDIVNSFLDYLIIDKKYSDKTKKSYEEELKKFHSILDVNEAEDAIYNRDLTDITDILKELMKDEKKKIRR